MTAVLVGELVRGVPTTIPLSGFQPRSGRRRSNARCCSAGRRASVTVDDETVGEIDRGLLVLLGVSTTMVPPTSPGWRTNWWGCGFSKTPPGR